MTRRRKSGRAVRAKRARARRAPLDATAQALQPRWWQVQLRDRLEPLLEAASRKVEAARERTPGVVGTLVLGASRILLIVTLPFVVLVRGAVWLYERQGFPTWLALAGAAVATLALLTLYGVWVSRRLTGRARLGLVAKWVAAPLVAGYCGYSLLYLSGVNVKDDEVRSVYTATHPLLRVAVSTLILADRNAVITDLTRTPDDYHRMGLTVNQRSLHYPQADGWVHAVDIRVRGPLSALFVELYFRGMGFETLRHVGTADHLHVALTPR